MSGHPAPRREAGKGTAPTLSARTKGGGGLGTDFDCDGGLVTLNDLDGVPHALRAKAAGMGQLACGETFVAPLNAIDGAAHSLYAKRTASGVLDGQVETFVGFNSREDLCPAEIAGSPGSSSPQAQAVALQNWRVRRLTPRECERLQGFPDDYTAVPYRGKDAADGPRYKALGNSMAINAMRWIGTRIQMVDDLAVEVAA